MLQINVALGILYIGLEVARYRNRLHEDIVEMVRSQAIEEDESTSKIYSNLTRTNSDFSQKHHYLSMWVGELPEKYSADLKNTPANLFSGVEDTQELPWAYRWFKRDGDRWTTFVLASLIPIFITWGLAVSAEKISVVASYVVIALGQLCVIVHVFGGRRMVKKHRTTFSQTLKQVVDKLEATRSDEQTREFPHSRPPSPSSGWGFGTTRPPGGTRRPKPPS